MLTPRTEYANVRMAMYGLNEETNTFTKLTGYITFDEEGRVIELEKENEKIKIEYQGVPSGNGTGTIYRQ